MNIEGNVSEDCEHKDIEIVDDYYGHPDHTTPIRHTYCVECGVEIGELDQDEDLDRER